MSLIKKTFSIPIALDKLLEQHKLDTGQSRDGTVRAGLLQEMRAHYGAEYVRDWLAQEGICEEDLTADDDEN